MCIYGVITVVHKIKHIQIPQRSSASTLLNQNSFVKYPRTKLQQSNNRILPLLDTMFVIRSRISVAPLSTPMTNVGKASQRGRVHHSRTDNNQPFDQNSRNSFNKNTIWMSVVLTTHHSYNRVGSYLFPSTVCALLDGISHLAPFQLPQQPRRRGQTRKKQKNTRVDMATFHAFFKTQNSPYRNEFQF